MKSFSVLLLALVAFSTSVSASNSDFKLKTALQLRQAKAQSVHEERIYKKILRQPKVFRHKLKFRLTGRQFRFLTSLFITMTFLDVAYGQEFRSAAVCDDNGVCYDSNEDELVTRQQDELLAPHQACLPFVDPSKLHANTISANLWQRELSKTLPKIGKEVDHNTLCTVHTPAERGLIIKRFNKFIATKVIDFVNLARKAGKKVGIILGTAQNKCGSVYQQIQLERVANFLGVRNVVYTADIMLMQQALTTVIAYNNAERMPGLQAPLKPIINFIPIAYAHAYQFNITVIQSRALTEDPNIKYMQHLNATINIYNQIQISKTSNDPQEKLKGQLLVPLLEDLLKTLGPCPDFFAREHALARDIRMVQSDFIFFVGTSILAELQRTLKSDTHLFLMIRPVGDHFEHLTGNIQPAVGKFVTKKCADDYDDYVQNYENAVSKNNPCAIHPVVDDALIMK